jgi:hypothetical protein
VLEWKRDRGGFLARIPVVVLTTSREGADVNRAYHYFGKKVGTAAHFGFPWRLLRDS